MKKCRRDECPEGVLWLSQPQHTDSTVSLNRSTDVDEAMGEGGGDEEEDGESEDDNEDGQGTMRMGRDWSSCQTACVSALGCWDVGFIGKQTESIAPMGRHF